MSSLLVKIIKKLSTLFRKSQFFHHYSVFIVISCWLNNSLQRYYKYCIYTNKIAKNIYYSNSSVWKTRQRRHSLEYGLFRGWNHESKTDYTQRIRWTNAEKQKDWVSQYLIKAINLQKTWGNTNSPIGEVFVDYSRTIHRIFMGYSYVSVMYRVCVGYVSVVYWD